MNASNKTAEELFLSEPLPLEFNNPVFNKDYGELPIGTSYGIGLFKLPKEHLNYYLIKIFAKNGSYSINAKLRYSDGKWESKMAIFKRDTNEFLTQYNSK